MIILQTIFITILYVLNTIAMYGQFVSVLLGIAIRDQNILDLQSRRSIMIDGVQLLRNLLLIKVGIFW